MIWLIAISKQVRLTISKLENNKACAPVISGAMLVTITRQVLTAKQSNCGMAYI